MIVSDGIRDFFPLKSQQIVHPGRFRNKRTTFSNPRVQEQFINQSIKQRNFSNKVCGVIRIMLVRLNKKRNIEGQNATIGDKSPRQCRDDTCCRSSKISWQNSQVQGAKKVLPLSTQEKCAKNAEKEQC